MAHHVAKRDQPVLDVVIDLAREVADGGAPLGLAHAGGTGPQPRGKVTEQPGQGADFIGAGIEVDVETIEIEHGGLVGKGGQPSGDARRYPHGQQQRRGRGSKGGQEKPRVHAVQKSSQRRQGLSDLHPRLHDLELRSGAGADQWKLKLADGGIVCGVRPSR